MCWQGISMLTALGGIRGADGAETTSLEDMIDTHELE